MQWSEEQIQKTVTVILEELRGKMGGGPGTDPGSDGGLTGVKQVDSSGVLGVKTGSIRTESFQGRNDVRVKDLTTLSESPRMAAGVMEVENTVFPWTLTYDEFDIVLEGRLEIQVNGKTISGGPGDVLYIPKGTSVCFKSPNKARFVYVTYPADWDKQ